MSLRTDSPKFRSGTTRTEPIRYYQDSDGDAVFETEELSTRSQLEDALPGITDFLDIEFGQIGY